MGHIGVNVDLEDCDSISGYGFMETVGNPGGSDEEDCVVQGRGGTNPLNKKKDGKKKQVTPSAVTSMNEKPARPAWIERASKGIIPGHRVITGREIKDSVEVVQDEVVQVTRNKGIVIVKEEPAKSRSAKPKKSGPVLAECEAFAKKSKKGRRVTLEWWKCYLDSCASYHTFFVKCFLTSVTEGGKTMSGRCNAGVTKTATRGWFGSLHVWLNKNGIANLILIPILEADGCEVSTQTKGVWVVYTPAGEKTVFKRDTRVCRGMPYIDLREKMDGFALIETIEGNIDKFLVGGGSNEDIKKAMLSRTIQKQIGCPPDREFKRIVSTKSLKNCPITVNEIANAASILGLRNRDRLKGAETRRKPNGRVGAEDRVKIPRDWYKLNKFVTLTVDVMFVT
jgi:hypothetical protein